MAGTAWITPSGGFWPLGKITVASAGTPVPLTNNVGAQAEGSMKMARRCRAFIFSGPLTTTLGKNIYVLKAGATSKSQTNMVIAVIPCGTSSTLMPNPTSLPVGCLLENAQVTPDFFSLDSDEDGASVQVTAIYG